jgi:hypothetical protein
MVDDNQYHMKKGQDGSQSLGERSVSNELSNGVETENKPRAGGRFGNGENLKKPKKLINVAIALNQFKKRNFSHNFYENNKRPGN